MRLAIIRQRYNPFGGAERFVERAVEALARQGTEVTVIAREWTAPPASGVRILACSPPYTGRRSRDASFARAACAAAATGGFDLVQSHERLACCDVYRAGDGVHRQWLRHRARQQGVLGRLATALNPYHRYVLAAERAMFEGERLRAVICNSRMVRDDVLAHFRIDPSKLHVVYNGIDRTRFSPEAARAAAGPVRARLGVPADAPVVLFVGSGFERKGVDRLLRAFAASDTVGARLVVVGADKGLEAARRSAARLGLAERVIFTGGEREVLGFYGLADLFVLPTLYDPMPNAAIEALACGVPVVTTTQCGAAELVRAGENGYVCDALDEGALSAAITAGLRTLVTPAARQAAVDAVADLSIDAMAARLVALYASLLGARAA
jgi:UDP-glucose:(heptosyl)LPS alpha-1,3-glucosyltransferase